MKLWNTIKGYLSAKSNDTANHIRKANNVSFATDTVEKMKEQKKAFATGIAEERTELNKLNAVLKTSKEYLAKQKADATNRKTAIRNASPDEKEALKQEQRTCVIGIKSNEKTIATLEKEILNLGKVINKHESQFGALTADIMAAETRLKVAKAKSACNKTIASLELADDSNLAALEEDVELEENYNDIMGAERTSVESFVSEDDMKEWY